MALSLDEQAGSLSRLRAQQNQYRNYNNRYNYYNDPYYYTANNYRYQRDGRSYQTNVYGARLLKQAVNQGYAEGFRSGRADRMDRWKYDYWNAYAYQDANMGYKGYYVKQSEYNYYFRQGFQKGYRDGYYNRYQYGRYDEDNNDYNIWSSVLSSILGLQQN